MGHPTIAAGAAFILMVLASTASAHGIAGKRVFPTTLTIDDPAVSDEASLPTITHVRHGATGDDPANRQTDITGEWDKRITEHFGAAVNYGYTTIDRVGQSGASGFSNLNTTLKYEFLQNAPHELLMSAGVTRSWGGTGAQRVGASPIGSTTPTLYFGKGFGDLPDGASWLKPFAITGTFSYQFADVRTRSTTAIDPDTGISSLMFANNPNQLVMGLSVQYSTPYLQANIRDLGLPDFLRRITPLVEFAYTTPATGGSGQNTVGTIAPGFIYSANSYQIGVEALIPATRASGTNVGFIAQAHFFFDDIFPKSLGRPLFGD
ncbi:MAG: hypothetical protein HYR63_01820 [Proteobacteria bacterium]|nr:hypothetical protein [Pseudomonadota bacterium]